MSVVLLDEHDIGWGASGRSGGQCNPIWRQSPDDLAQMLGSNRAERLVETTLNAANDLFADIARHQIDCDPVQNGWVQAAHTRKSRRTLERLHQGWAAVGGSIDILEGAEVETRSGSPEYQFALFHRTGGHVQPLSLTRGYARAAHDLGAQVFCGDRVQEIKRVQGQWQVSTARGHILAKQVVLTTNAYTPRDLWPGLQQTIMPMVSISLATAPLSPALQKISLAQQGHDCRHPSGDLLQPLRARRTTGVWLCWQHRPCRHPWR